MTKHVLDSVGNKRPVEPERNDWGYPTQVDRMLYVETIENLSGRLNQLEHNLERTNEQLLELAENCDALVKLMKQVATR